jgi:hypothetical protein
MDTTVLIVFLLFVVFVTVDSICLYIKAKSLSKKIINYKGEKVLYQSSKFSGNMDYHFTILTTKKLYLIKMRLFPLPINWKIDSKSIKEISYKRDIFLNYDLIKVNNKKTHILKDKKEAYAFFKKLKSVNPKIKFSGIN